MYDNRKKNRAKTRQRRSARHLKYAGLIEMGVELEIVEGESRIFVAGLGGVRNG